MRNGQPPSLPRGRAASPLPAAQTPSCSGQCNSSYTFWWPLEGICALPRGYFLRAFLFRRLCTARRVLYPGQGPIQAGLGAGLPPSLLFGSHPASHRRAGGGGGGKVCSPAAPGKGPVWFWLYEWIGFFCFFFPSFGFKLGLTCSLERNPPPCRGQALLCPDKPGPTSPSVPAPVPPGCGPPAAGLPDGARRRLGRGARKCVCVIWGQGYSYKDAPARWQSLSLPLKPQPAI